MKHEAVRDAILDMQMINFQNGDFEKANKTPLENKSPFRDRVKIQIIHILSNTVNLRRWG